MGCASSKNAQNRKEAEAYAKRKKAGFKDPGLEKHRKACVNQKKHLKHVQDPVKKRHEKQEKIHTNQLKTAKGPGIANQGDIIAARGNLKHRR
jgi:hypothetical protein